MNNLILKRFVAFIIDLLIVSLVSSVMFVVAKIMQSKFVMRVDGAFIITLLLCKDCINGQSLGKRLMKIQVVDKNENKNVSEIRYILRNLFVIFWIIEISVLFITKNKRIGDYVAKTKVISIIDTQTLEFKKDVVIAFFLCWAIILPLLLILFKMLQTSTVQLLF